MSTPERLTGEMEGQVIEAAQRAIAEANTVKDLVESLIRTCHDVKLYVVQESLDDKSAKRYANILYEDRQTLADKMLTLHMQMLILGVFLRGSDD